MIEIISGTDRAQSNTIKIAKLLLDDYRGLKVEAELLDLNQLDYGDAVGANYKPKGSFLAAVERVTRADALVIVVPEYNGSFPGALKLFIDYWKYPDSFENRPVAFVGLGARWGGLRPIEHLQQVFNYRNAYIFPNRVFIQNIKDVFRDGQIMDPLVADLLKIQSREFLKFIQALKSQNLDANSRRRPAP